MTTTAAKTATIVFEVGETYTCSWPCASHLTTPQTVIARTAKFVTIRDDDTGEECRVGVKVSTCGEPYEYVCPFGTYSMCAVMSADQKVETVPEPVHLAEGWTDSYTREDGTTTCCNTFSSIGDCGEYCKGCYNPISGTIGDDGHPLG